MLAMVARSASARLSRPAPKNSTNLPTTPFLRSICVTVSTRSVAVTPSLQLAGQLEADDVGDEHGDRLAEHRRLGLDAADAPAEHAEAVDHGGVAVGAVAAVREGEGVAGIGRGPDHLREVFQVHLVADAGARRHDAEIVEGVLAPAQELVALAVALELDVHVLLQRGRRCRTSRPSPNGRSPGRPAPAGSPCAGRRRA